MSPTGDLHVTLIFLWGGVSLELAQGPSRVALAWHKAKRGTPFGETSFQESSGALGTLRWVQMDFNGFKSIKN